MSEMYEARFLKAVVGGCVLALLLLPGCTPSSPPKSTSPATDPTPSETPVPPNELSPLPAHKEMGAESPAAAEPEEASESQGTPPDEAPERSFGPAPRREAPKHRQRSKQRSESNWDRATAPPSLDELRSQLERLSAMPPRDCDGAARQRQAICSLAEQLCSMVERDPNVASVESHCQEARARCRRAQAQVREQCPDER